MTSPIRKPARAAAPSPTLVISAPPLPPRSFLLASDTSATLMPRDLFAVPACGLGASIFFATALSGSASATTTVKSRVVPLRQTLTVAVVPGLVSPTIRGKSVDLLISLPLKLRITSPASMPPCAAGAPGSALRTNAPRGFPKPKLSATSLLISPIATPIRPRTKRPVVRSWSATRIASSMGIANEIPI